MISIRQTCPYCDWSALVGSSSSSSSS
jgi:hypothetical protein